MSWVDLAEGINKEFLEKQIKAGITVFGFQQEHTVQHYKIIRVNKKKGRYWAKRVKLYTEEEAQEIINRRHK